MDPAEGTIDLRTKLRRQQKQSKELETTVEIPTGLDFTDEEVDILHGTPAAPETTEGEMVTDLVVGDEHLEAPPLSVSALVACLYCSELFATEANRDEHLKTDCPNYTHSPSRKSASKKLTSKKRTIEESQNSYLKEIKCPFCHINMKSMGNLARHIKKYHPDSDAEGGPVEQHFSVQCPYCLKFYSSEKTLTRHVNFVHGLTTSTKVSTDSPTPTSKSKMKSHKTRSDQENKKPKIESRQNSQKKSPSKMASRIPDSEISIYYDSVSMQCLICLGRYPTVKKMRNHIREAHASNICVDSQFDDSQSLSEISAPVHLDQFPDESLAAAGPHLDSSLNFDAVCEKGSSNVAQFVCHRCGKCFESVSEYEKHATLPHKISIKT